VSRAVSKAVDRAGTEGGGGCVCRERCRGRWIEPGPRRGVCVVGGVEDGYDALALKWALRPEVGADVILR